jgi:hypothetical protein
MMLVELISLKEGLHFFVPQHEHVVFDVLIDRVFGNLLLVLFVVLLDTLK